MDIQAIVMDLDGTMTPSYKALLAVDEVRHMLEKDYKVKPDAAQRFLVDYLEPKQRFQNVLHTEKAAEEALKKFIADHGIEGNTKPLFDRMKKIQAEGFELYPGVAKLLDRAAEAGTFVAIYTNSPDFFAARRMDKAGVDASQVGALWAKKHDLFEPGVWKQRDDAGPNVRRMADILIPYEWSKPNATPMFNIMDVADMKPSNILSIGEGVNDFLTAYNKGNWSAHFALMEKGASEICQRTNTTNNLLRPGKEPLGIDHVNSIIHEKGADQAIIRMKQGFADIHRLIDQGAIRLSAPMVPIHVQDGELVADAHGAAARSRFTPGGGRNGYSLIPVFGGGNGG